MKTIKREYIAPQIKTLMMGDLMESIKAGSGDPPAEGGAKESLPDDTSEEDAYQSTSVWDD